MEQEGQDPTSSKETAEGTKTQGDKVSETLTPSSPFSEEGRALWKEYFQKGGPSWRNFLLDPMGGHRKALTELSGKELWALGMGLSFVFWILQLAVYTTMFKSILHFWGGASTAIFFRSLSRAFLPSLVPIAAFLLSFLGLGAMQQKNANGTRAWYATGVCLLPMTIFLLVSFVGHGIFGFLGVILLGFFMGCYGVLLVYSTLVDVYGLGVRSAFFATPAFFCLAGFFTYIFVRPLFG